MRRPRLKAPPSAKSAFYHCLSRVVDRRFVFGPSEREYFVALLRECAAFSEIRVLTFCVLSNHFHLLLEVPPRPDSLPSAEEILAKLACLSGHQSVGTVRQRLEAVRHRNDVDGETALLARYYARLWDLSAFMKLLKQRFTQWFNARHGRHGTLWEDRFRSVLVEGQGRALVTMAAYIDLNPVRAGLVSDPKDYRWSGYGEAVAGQAVALQGLLGIARALSRTNTLTVTEALATYRQHVFLAGDERREARGEDGLPERGALSREAVQRVLAEGGRLPLAEYLRCRVRYFCDGAVFGSREFVEEIFRSRRGWFGVDRKSGARRMRGLEPGVDLCTARDFRLRVFG